jgi:hypothetical protein
VFQEAAAAQADANDAWIAHCQLRELVHPKSSAATQTALRLSWIAYCRHAFMAQLLKESADCEKMMERWPDVLVRTALDFDYVQLLQSRGSVQVTLAPNQMVGDYPAHLVLASARLLLETLDLHGWSPSAGAYLDALFWRYALLLHEDDTETPERAYEPDNGDVIDPDAASPLLPGDCLTDFFLETGERLFFHMLWRNRALQSYMADAATATAGDPAAELARTAQELCDTVTHVLRHDMLGDTTTEAVKTPIMDYFLWPGEREHMRFVYPDVSDTDANSVLFRLRPDGYARLKDAFDKVALPSLISDYTKALNASAAAAPGGDLEAAVCERQSVAERIVLLATQTCIDASVVSASGPHGAMRGHAYLDNAALDPPYDRPPASAAAARAAMGIAGMGWPIFIAIWGVYTILLPRGRPWVTPHLALAVRRWLAEAVRSGALNPSHLSILFPSATHQEHFLSLA